ncbi:MAG TPA: hypothetical protein VLE93_03180 [Candidatus Saccharimonadales bacterium]|nr:hypothetical protein [Candidatus Saccharimonadales bacterium]
MLTGYFYWWYGEGYKQSWQVAAAVLYEVADFFSLEILVKSWFAPWKNDVLSAQNAALSDTVKLWEQNLASRFIGIVLRSIVIFVAVISLAFLTILLGVGLVLWSVVPALIFILPVLAVWIVTR